MEKEEYIKKYNSITEKGGKSSCGADYFRMTKEILEKSGYKEDMSVLDYGCGWGSLLTIINPEKYIGVDISDFILKEAVKLFPDKKFFVNNIGDLSIEPVDFIVSHSVFTHVPEKIVGEALADIKNNLKKDGIALIDIFYGKDGGIYQSYNHEKWISILEENGLSGKFLESRDRDEFFTHNYYKITWL